MTRRLFLYLCLFIQIDPIGTNTIKCIKPDEYRVGDRCEKCPKCKIGWGLTQSCRSASGQMIRCVRCVDGETYQDEGKVSLQCKNCTSCPNHYKRRVKLHCRRQVNAACGECLENYFDPDHDYLGSEPRKCVHCGLRLYHSACSKYLALWKTTSPPPTTAPEPQLVTVTLLRKHDITNRLAHLNNVNYLWTVACFSILALAVILLVILVLKCTKVLRLPYIRRATYPNDKEDPSKDSGFTEESVPSSIMESKDQDTEEEEDDDVFKHEKTELIPARTLRRRISSTNSNTGSINQGMVDERERVMEPLQKIVRIDEVVQGASHESPVHLRDTPRFAYDPELDKSLIDNDRTDVESSPTRLQHSPTDYHIEREVLSQPCSSKTCEYIGDEQIPQGLTDSMTYQKLPRDEDPIERANQPGHVNIINITNVTGKPASDMGGANYNESICKTRKFSSKDDIERAHEDYLQQMKREKKENYKKAMEIARGKQIKDIAFNFKTTVLYLTLDAKTVNVCPNWKTLGANLGVDELKLKNLQTKDCPSEGLFDILRTNGTTVPEILSALKRIGHNDLVAQLSDWIVNNLSETESTTHAVEETASDTKSELTISKPSVNFPE